MRLGAMTITGDNGYKILQDIFDDVRGSVWQLNEISDQLPKADGKRVMTKSHRKIIATLLREVQQGCKNAVDELPGLHRNKAEITRLRDKLKELEDLWQRASEILEEC